MRKLINKSDLDQKRLILLSFTMLMTAIVVVFSTYMSASFFSGLGTDNFSKFMFCALGIFMELAKICAGMAVIFAFATNNKSLRNLSIGVLVIFSAVSFIKGMYPKSRIIPKYDTKK